MLRVGLRAARGRKRGRGAPRPWRRGRSQLSRRSSRVAGVPCRRARESACDGGGARLHRRVARRDCGAYATGRLVRGGACARVGGGLAHTGSLSAHTDAARAAAAAHRLQPALRLAAGSRTAARRGPAVRADPPRGRPAPLLCKLLGRRRRRAARQDGGGQLHEP